MKLHKIEKITKSFIRKAYNKLTPNAAFTYIQDQLLLNSITSEQYIKLNEYNYKQLQLHKGVEKWI